MNSLSNRSWLYLGLIFLAFWIVVVVRFDPLGESRPLGSGRVPMAGCAHLEGQPVDFARFRERRSS